MFEVDVKNVMEWNGGMEQNGRKMNTAWVWGSDAKDLVMGYTLAQHHI